MLTAAMILGVTLGTHAHLLCTTANTPRADSFAMTVDTRNARAVVYDRTTGEPDNRRILIATRRLIRVNDDSFYYAIDAEDLTFRRYRWGRKGPPDLGRCRRLDREPSLAERNGTPA